ncbi:hypothetical protein CWO90_35185 [Bradyrhizobium sp. Leo121]|nr:hypothetical protein CWO90_35185 [Bradyrhizobium sp. Leo121]
MDLDGAMLMTADVIYGVDFQEKTWNAAVQRHNASVLDRLQGVPANVGPANPKEPGCPFVADYAPSEYCAPERDGA